LLTLTGHGGSVNSAAFSPDGKRLASGGDGQRVKLWDVKTGRLRATLKAYHRIESVVFSPDSKTLAAGGLGDTIKLWDITAFREPAV